MENIQGNIHSIETFGTVDGPGIRFVVFMQGCHLQCKYCHNRDTWTTSTNRLITVSELVEKITRYENYMKLSNGGVTISGGEPLLQIKFLIPLFEELKKLGIHTAIDTSGMFQITEDIKKLLSLTDLVLLDIKHINPEKCKDLVGRSNELELRFAQYLSDNNIPIWIRQVLVPGLTDSEEDLIALRDFINSLKTVRKVEILPYHNAGKTKWESLGLDYSLENIRTATNDDVNRAKKILNLE